MCSLYLSKCLACAFIWGKFTHDGDGKPLPLSLYPIKYLNESLLYDFLWNNTISSISTSLILMGVLFLWKSLLMMPFSPSYTGSCSMFYTKKRKKVKFFSYIFWFHGNFFDILLAFVSFLQTYYGICFFHIICLFLSYYLILLWSSSDKFLCLSLACSLNLFYHY